STIQLPLLQGGNCPQFPRQLVREIDHNTGMGFVETLAASHDVQTGLIRPHGTDQQVKIEVLWSIAGKFKQRFHVHGRIHHAKKLILAVIKWGSNDNTLPVSLLQLHRPFNDSRPSLYGLTHCRSKLDAPCIVQSDDGFVANRRMSVNNGQVPTERCTEYGGMGVETRNQITGIQDIKVLRMGAELLSQELGVAHNIMKNGLHASLQLLQLNIGSIPLGLLLHVRVQ